MREPQIMQLMLCVLAISPRSRADVKSLCLACVHTERDVFAFTRRCCTSYLRLTTYVGNCRRLRSRAIFVCLTNTLHFTINNILHSIIVVGRSVYNGNLAKTFRTFDSLHQTADTSATGVKLYSRTRVHAATPSPTIKQCAYSCLDGPCVYTA